MCVFLVYFFLLLCFPTTLEGLYNVKTAGTALHLFAPSLGWFALAYDTVLTRCTLVS